MGNVVLGNIVKCTAEQYRQLKAGQTVNGHTYNSAYIYVCEPEDVPVITLAVSQIVSQIPLVISLTDEQKAVVENLNNNYIKIDISTFYSNIGLDSPYAWIKRNAVKNIGNTSNGAVLYEFTCNSNDIDATASMTKLGELGIYYFYQSAGAYASYNKCIIITSAKVTISSISHATNLENGTANSSLLQKKYGTTFTTSNPNATGYTSEQTVAAAGNYSSVFGGAGRAIGAFTFVEGENNIAVGNDAHAEGYSTFALGAQSHAEGLQTSAKGTASHAEGVQTIAQGNYSHAEGYITKAEGLYSHAGGSNTIAKAESQTVIGKYNVEDTDGTYAFIIGNGGAGARSNAFTVDWNGNVITKGDITPNSLNSKNLGSAGKWWSSVYSTKFYEAGQELKNVYLKKPYTTTVYSTTTDVMSSTVNGSKTTTVTLTYQARSGDTLLCYFYHDDTYSAVNSCVVEVNVYAISSNVLVGRGYSKTIDGGATIEIYCTLTANDTLSIKTVKSNESSGAPAGTRALSLTKIEKKSLFNDTGAI